MKLQRQFDPSVAAAYKAAAAVAKAQGQPEPPQPPATHVVCLNSGTRPEQNFSDRMIEAAEREGWVKIDGDTLTMKTDGEPLRYKITRRPGYFCKSTGASIPVSDRAWLKFRLANDGAGSRAEALAWLAGKGLPATDYDITTAYHCVLDAKQHAKYSAVTDGGIVRAAHEMEA